MAYDRYSKYRVEGKIAIPPFIEIRKKTSDFYVTYNKIKDRLDIMSYQYYGDSDFGWLILQANPEYGGLEYDIPDKARLRIPYPLSSSLEDYTNKIEEYKQRYEL